MGVSGGRLGSLQPASGTWKTLYKPASGIIATVNVTMANTTASDVTACYIAQVQSASADPTPGVGETKLNNRTLKAANDPDGKDVLQFTGIVLNGSNNDQIVVKVGTSTAVDVTADGVTEQ